VHRHGVGGGTTMGCLVHHRGTASFCQRAREGEGVTAMVTAMVTTVHRPKILESWCFGTVGQGVTATPMAVHRP
jgi:hypothetical protein